MSATRGRVSLGSLRHRITIGSIPATQDAFGGAQPAMTPSAFTPITGGTVSAKIMTLTAEDLYAEGHPMYGANVEIDIRYLATVIPQMICKFTDDQNHDHYFQIKEVNDGERKKRWMKLTCFEAEITA